MRDDCTEDTSEITWSEGNAQLGGFIVVLFSFSEDVIVEELHESFKSDEFYDSVRHLTSPQRTKTLVHSADTYIAIIIPSSALILLSAPPSELGYSKPGLESWIFSLIASQGHKNVSAITSADPEAIDHPIFLYYSAFSSPTIPL